MHQFEFETLYVSKIRVEVMRLNAARTHKHAESSYKSRIMRTNQTRLLYFPIWLKKVYYPTTKKERIHEIKLKINFLLENQEKCQFYLRQISQDQ